ncbi:TIGR03088 family PEP-CTERM/XrtA system glycosyltransferase [Aestuariibacter sp. AA17]|uniref:TIGR03088 family PEP-CTERM/XrtA system glycosyltransferase n=1 Tax=Fluctibacter corallii TaxID=2984329 RepID=A0ABT3ABP6_9ALTE|nr:TIGR03088 family PEP-CTERM/XrtA system glycosyltransferase [Aestuariibacter sp. AA17]MCV2886044.1 TIGR03088 family PEP-CTERM/XrtA system glycosyltransferase [Aestuariibacter sp. AA17]
MIKVLHVVHRFSIGGLENGMVNLINGLPEDHYQHVIVTMKGHCSEFIQRIHTQNVTFYDLDKQDGHDFSVFGKLNRILKQEKPDVLHTRNTASLEMQLVGWWRRIPLRIHGEHGWDVNDMHGSNVRYQRLRRLMSRFTHQYVALSKEAKDYLRDVIGIASSRINHICNGVDDRKFMPKQTASEQIVFGCVGRLEEVKNHIYLLQGFAHLIQSLSAQPQDSAAESDRVKLHIVGDGSQRNKLEAYIQENKLEQYVWLAGDRADVPDLMKAFDVFVLPSLAEGISNTILEAMASGLPVIATNVGGNPELVDENVTGYLVGVDTPEDLSDRMRELVVSPSLVNKMGQAARARVEEKFSLTAMVGAYDDLYRSKQA